MTFAPVLPLVVLLVIAVVVVALRLLTMRRLHATAGARWTTVGRWAGLTLAILLILIAAARPGIEHGERGSAVAQQSTENTNVFFLVDRSADSAIEDYGDRQPRMSAIRSDIEALIDQYPAARFAVIAFASRSSLDWPLSEDAWSLRPEVARLSPYPTNDTTEDVNAAAAANVLRYQLIAAGQQYPDSKKPGVLLRFGRRRLARTAGRVRTARRCGGRRRGVRVRRSAKRTRSASRSPNSSACRMWTATTAAHSRSRLPAAARHRPPRTRRRHRASPTARELYWVFTLPAAVLILFELFASIRDLRRTRSATRDVTP